MAVLQGIVPCGSARDAVKDTILVDAQVNSVSMPSLLPLDDGRGSGCLAMREGSVKERRGMFWFGSCGTAVPAAVGYMAPSLGCRRCRASERHPDGRVENGERPAIRCPSKQPCPHKPQPELSCAKAAADQLALPSRVPLPTSRLSRPNFVATASAEQDTTMSNFDPNAILRGAQLTLVGREFAFTLE